MGHTPGPWSIGKSADGTLAICVPVHPSEGSGFAVATVNRPRRMGTVRGDMEANAHLIATAPELLEALEWILESVSPGERVALQAIIAKAEGKQP
jgi:hypothetical protein